MKIRLDWLSCLPFWLRRLVRPVAVGPFGLGGHRRWASVKQLARVDSVSNQNRLQMMMLIGPISSEVLSAQPQQGKADP